MRIGSCKSTGREITRRRPRERWWSASGRTAGWRSGIEDRSCVGRRLQSDRGGPRPTNHARWLYPTAGLHPRQAIRGNNGMTGCRSRVWRSTRFGARQLFWRLPALRPKRSAYGLAGLRFGSRQNNWRRTSQRGHFKRGLTKMQLARHSQDHKDGGWVYTDGQPASKMEIPAKPTLYEV